MILLALTGCFGQFPLINEPPNLVRINGRVMPTRRNQGQPTLPAYTPGQPYELTVEVSDPEGDGVQVFFPGVQGEVDFDPDARSGVWHVPETYSGWGLTVYLRDTRKNDPAGAEWTFTFDNDSGAWWRPDSGDSADSGSDTGATGDTGR
ncbi:MAG: hypothetical protein H6737_26315 [Alphaproteobacteria bacterium]|nr:hypothetical protein [Alphaproteobacteria bacterium]